MGRIVWGFLALVGALSLGLASSVSAQIMRPGSDFDPSAAPPLPDYERNESWAALPSREDAADVVPPGRTDRQAEGATDVFFLHPTSHLVGRGWNADVANAGVNARTDRESMRSQASVFNAVGPVYAPRYRQGILYAYVHHDESSLAARELAYTDVVRAFERFLALRGTDRPFVLAGHSQGAHHALRLLEERIVGKPLQKRMVAAYLLGVPLPHDKLQRTLVGLPLCTSVAQTGCLISWNTISSGADRARFRRTWHHYPSDWERNAGKRLICTNPFSWSTNEEWADAKSRRRAVIASSAGLRLAAGPAKARCDDGLLVISPDPGVAFRSRGLQEGDYHRADLSLFHVDLRVNLLARAAAFLGEGDAP